MQQVNEIINRNQRTFPEFQYYLSITSQIDINCESMPDLSIEACKSLIEGVCKTILNKTGISYKTKGHFIDSPNDLLMKVFSALKTYRVEVDETLIDNTSNIVFRVAKIRNDRGDLSHGRAVPKIDTSSIELTHFIIQLTDAVVRYLLEIYFSTDFSYIEINYEDNPEFNNMLDESFPLDGIVSYSKALYNQDKTYYEQLLLDYKSSQEII